MSVCKRFILPLLKSTNKQKLISVWKIKSRAKYHSNNLLTLNAGWDELRIQFRSLFTSGHLHNVISFNLSDIGEGIREVIVKEWFVKEGDTVAQFDNICEVQSDKASVTITSRYDGIVTRLYHSVDDIALVGNPLVDIETGDSSDKSESNVSKSEVEQVKSQTVVHKEDDATIAKIKGGANRGFAIPSVRRIAKENKIILTDVKGMGKDGRVLKEDILSYIQQLSNLSLDGQEDVEIEPVRGYRKTMIQTMTQAMKIPHFVYHDDIRVTRLVELRHKLGQNNVKITYLPFFIKAISNALARFPILNARLDDTAANLLYHKSHNIAIAMDTPAGLAVPVIKNVERKSIVEIGTELIRLQQLGKQMKFAPDDLAGGTFTLSNIGAIGGTYAKPIILPPQSAILALGSFQKLPRSGSDGGSAIVFEDIAPLSGAADHRIIDGATMAKFCNMLKQQIEEPYFLLLNV